MCSLSITAKNVTKPITGAETNWNKQNTGIFLHQYERRFIEYRSALFLYRIAEPGCLSRIRFFPFWIPGLKDSVSALKNIGKYLTQKIVPRLSEIWSGMFLFIPDLDFLPIPDPWVKKAPDPWSAPLFLSSIRILKSIFYINSEMWKPYSFPNKLRHFLTTSKVFNLRVW